MRFIKTKEKIFKKLFIIQDYGWFIGKKTILTSRIIFFLIAIVYLGFILRYIGFPQEAKFYPGFEFYMDIFYGLFFTKFLPDLLTFKKRKHLELIIDGILFIFCLLIGWVNLHETGGGSLVSAVFGSFGMLNLGIVLLIATGLHRIFRLINSVKMSPSLLFVLSFLFIILVGSGLLMLPNAQAVPISYLDSLFTSASAVCVTGLVVVDTASTFTPLGKIFILALIQIGGLGIMAFTGFFGYVFTGSASYKDHLLLREMLSSEKLGGLFRMLIRIIMVTFLIETIGAFCIYFSIKDIGQNQVLFAAFHAVSAFCNAGFSTLPGGLASEIPANNQTFNFIIAILIILGGIGFPVLLAILAYGRNIFYPYIPGRPKRFTRNIGVRIVLLMTAVLLIAGTLGYYLLEKDRSLVNLEKTDQLLIAFFGSVSARTAGFNVVDITAWSYPTIFLMMFLMWVGASPGSTGGGIKTTTFALALKASYDFIRGRRTVEVSNREIGRETIYRVLVIIILSIIVIFLGFFSLIIIESDKNPVHLLFESFSAFATVGLSIVNTATLSSSGKGIIMALMFIGRLGPLTILTGMFIADKKKYYKYPIQDLIIN